MSVNTVELNAAHPSTGLGIAKRPTKGKFHHVVKVVWVDSQAETGWEKADHPVDRLDCLTVGYLIYSDEEKIVVAASRGRYGTEVEYNNRMVIPVSAIRSWRSLEMEVPEVEPT